MNSILGLPTTQKFDAANGYFHSHRRQILHLYPKGGATLTGLLSMMDNQPVSSHLTTWYEREYRSPVTKSRGTNPLTSDAPSTGDADDGTNLSNGSKTTSTDMWLKVETTKDMRTGLVLQLGDSSRLQFHVREVVRGVSSADEKGYVKVNPIRDYTAAAGDDTAGTVVRVISSAHGEGAPGQGLTSSRTKLPYAVQNQTQIMRTSFFFSGSVLQQGTKWDRSGPYKERAKDAVIEHMTQIERAIWWSRRSTTVRDSFSSGSEQEVVRTMSGLEEFLELWDAGSNGLSIDGSTYAPYSFKGPSTSDDDDEKRIIDNDSGTLTKKKFIQWCERVGRYHTSRTNEKLIICGSDALIALHEMFDKNSQFQAKAGDSVYGLDLTTIVTPFGRYHLMTHPLFNEDPYYRSRMVFLDIWSLKFRPVRNRDTMLLKNRQNNGDDLRKDEFLTEATLEFHHPRNNMIVKKVNQYSAS